jgi:hypothetical protein
MVLVQFRRVSRTQIAVLDQVAWAAGVDFSRDQAWMPFERQVDMTVFNHGNHHRDCTASLWEYRWLVWPPLLMS